MVKFQGVQFVQQIGIDFSGSGNLSFVVIFQTQLIGIMIQDRVDGRNIESNSVAVLFERNIRKTAQKLKQAVQFIQILMA